MHFKYSKSLDQYILSHLVEGRVYDCKEVEETRTTLQNKVLWGYYYKELLQAFQLKGIILNIDQVHFFCKTLIPKKRKRCAITKKYRTQEVSTTKLSKKEFSKYIEAIKEWSWSNLEYSIQNPTDDELLKYYDSII